MIHAASHARRTARGMALAAACAGVLASSAAWALDPEIGIGQATVEVWGLRDGLTGSRVHALGQTSDGYLWIAGFGGLARYDGARIVRLEIEPALDVMNMIPGPDTRLRIVPRHGPILCADHGALAACPSSSPHLPEAARVGAVHAGPRGEAALATDIGIFRQRGDAFELDAKAKNLDFGDITALQVDQRGRLWVGTNAGLFREGASGYDRVATGEAADVGTRSFFIAGERLWVLTDAHLLSIVDDHITPLTLPPELGVGFQSPLRGDRDGNLWIGGQKGLGRFREGRFDIFTKADGLPDNAISAIYEDHEGSLWIGTRNGSLAQFTDRTVSTKLGPPVLAEESVESVCEDADGVFWFGNRRGLLRWKDGAEHWFTKADGLPDDRVFAALRLRGGGGLVIGTFAGLARLRDGRIDRPVRFDGPVFSLYEDPQGTLWVGTANGLGRVAGDHLEMIANANGFDPRQIRGMGHDDRGTLWISSMGGLGHLVKGKLEAADPALGSQITGADRSIYRDPDGTLWWAAGSHLVRLRGGKFHAFLPVLGQTRDWLYQVIPDNHGYIWFGSGRTISRVSRAAFDAVAEGRTRDLPVTSFDMTDTRREIAARRARNLGVWKAHDGRLWFATLRGVVTIDPARVRTNPLPPPVVIERAMVDGSPALPEHTGAFPPGLGNLEFTYSGVTLLEPRKALHRYQLEGFDPQWIDAGTRRVAYYTNIPPGKYRFRVQASNADGVWNETGASVAIALAPHFYRTGWFYALFVAFVGGLVFSLYRARLGRLRGNYLAVFAERNRVARELHDSLLQGMSAVALELANIRSALPPAASGPAARLEAVEDALTQSLEETRRFVWNLREQPEGAGDLGLALDRLAGRLTEGRTVACTVTVEGAAVHLSHDVQGAMFKIAQEAITNALRHADAHTISVRLRYRDREVELAVIDDGHGFDPARAEGPEKHHFGLVGMSERARKLGARLAIDSQPGAGTRITFVMPTVSRRSTHA